MTSINNKLRDGIGKSILLSGAIYSDEGRTYLVMLPGEQLHDDPWEVCPDEEGWEDLLRRSDVVEVEALVRDPSTGKVGRAIVRKNERQVNKNVAWRVFRRDGFTCRYCGDDKSPLTVDHLVTWESGGPTAETNLVASCQKCNATRGEMPFEEWLESPYYKDVSKSLTPWARHANRMVAETLGDIPRTPIIKGKRRRR